MLEGIGLFVATVVLVTREPERGRTAVRVFVAAAAVVAVGNLGRLVQQTMAGALPAALSGILTARVAWVFPDVNAAGSYFVMALFAAAGLAASGRPFRSAWVAAALLIAAGLWMSGSRTAFVGAAVAASALTLITADRGRLSAAKALVPVVLGAVMVAGFLYLNNRSTVDNLKYSVQVRTEMFGRALRMFQEDPAFGIGAGRFYDLNAYPPPGPVAYPRENAHNNFLQALAELGLVGFAVLASLLLVAGYSAASIVPRTLPVARGRRLRDVGLPRYLTSQPPVTDARGVGCLLAVARAACRSPSASGLSETGPERPRTVVDHRCCARPHPRSGAVPNRRSPCSGRPDDGRARLLSVAPRCRRDTVPLDVESSGALRAGERQAGGDPDAGAGCRRDGKADSRGRTSQPDAGRWR